MKIDYRVDIAALRTAGNSVTPPKLLISRYPTQTTPNINSPYLSPHPAPLDILNIGVYFCSATPYPLIPNPFVIKILRFNSRLLLDLDGISR